MSDNKGSIVDLGWQNMAAVLDLEMPVKKKSRRFLWIPLLGILAISYVFTHFLNNRSGESIDSYPHIQSEISTPFQNQNQKLTNKTEIIANQTDEALSNNGSNESILSSINDAISAPTSGVTAQGSISSRGIIKSSSSIIYHTPLSTSYPYESSNHITSYDHLFDNNSNDIGLTKAEDFNASSIIALENAEKVEILGIFQLNSLIINDLNTNPDIRTPNILPIQIDSKKSSDAEFGLGVYVDHLINSDIFLVGGSIMYNKPLNSKLILSGRLSYSKSFTTYNNQTGIDFGNTIEMDTNASEPNEFDMSAADLRTDNLSIEIIEFSTIASYHINKRWVPYTGISLANSRGRYNIVNAANRALQPTMEDSNEITFGFLTGMEYTIIDRLGINLQYSYYTKRLIPVNDNKSGDQKIRLGLGFKF